jgi:hypothetical protein
VGASGTVRVASISSIEFGSSMLCQISSRVAPIASRGSTSSIRGSPATVISSLSPFIRDATATILSTVRPSACSSDAETCGSTANILDPTDSLAAPYSPSAVAATPRMMTPATAGRLIFWAKDQAIARSTTAPIATDNRVCSLALKNAAPMARTRTKAAASQATTEARRME